MPQMKSLAGVAANTRPLGGHPFAVRGHGADGGATGFGDAAQRLLDDVGKASALVAGRGVGAAVSGSARQVFVVPAHLADQLSRHTLGGCARGQQVHGVAHFGDLGEHHGGSGAHQQIGRVAHRGIAGDAGESIAATALQAHYEFRRGDRAAGGGGRVPRGASRRPA